MKLPKLWAHQEKAIEKAKTLKNMALFMGLGTGKSRTAIEILSNLIVREKRMLKILIVCPTATMFNWRNEFLKFTATHESNIHVLEGTLKKRSDAYILKSGIFITNCESFAFPVFSECIIKNPPEVLIIDESHRYKSPDAKRTKALIKVTYAMDKRPISHRYILTGSPVLNTQLDIFTQFLILDAGKTFGTNFFGFRAKYFNSIERKINSHKSFKEWTPKAGIDDEIKKLMAPIVVEAKKEECLDLPPVVYTEVEVTMAPDQKRAYEEMKRDFLAILDKKTGPGVAVAEIALTKALRMQQIVSGFVTMDDGENYRFERNPRVEVLSDILEDIVPSEKVIVWSIFKEDYAVIEKCVKSLGVKYAIVTGATKDKQAELDRFEKDPECRVMIASQAAGGTGVNMIQASTMIYFSKGFSLEHDMQSEARNHRGGSEIHKKITRIDLVCRHTIDEVVLKALREKKDLSMSILDLKHLLV